MLSSTIVLGLLFVLFVDTLARPSRGNRVISNAQSLQNSGLSGVHLKTPQPKHVASDSSNSFSWPIDNAKRALSGTEMRNISSLDAPRLALVDNSSNPVDTTKSTLVINDSDHPTCYGSRRSAPIANPSNCNMAIYQMISEGDPEEEVLWSGRHTWSLGTCKVELVPRADAEEYITRANLAQAAQRIKRRCITPAHGFRGGYVAVGLSTMFRLKVWASTSSGTVNETTSALSSPLDSPDLLEQEQVQR